MNGFEFAYLSHSEIEAITGLSYSSSSSQSSHSEIYQSIKNLPTNTLIDWPSLLHQAITKDSSLRWINDLQELSLSDLELNSFFTEIQQMDVDSYDEPTKKHIFLFAEASLLVENQLQSSPSHVLKASLFFFSLHDQLARTKFQLDSFIDSAVVQLDLPEKDLLSLFMLYIKSCASTDNPDSTLFIQSVVKNVFLVESRHDWLPVFLDCFDEKTISKHSPFSKFLASIEKELRYTTLLPHLTLHKVFQHYWQLLKIDALGTVLSTSSDAQMRKEFLVIPSLRLAHNIVSLQHSPFSFTRSRVKSMYFPHIKLHYDAVSGDVYLFSSHIRAYSEYSEKTYKSHLNVRLPHSHTEIPAYLSVEKTRSNTSLISMRHSADTHQRISGNRGIWPLFGTCFYQKQGQEKTYRIRTFSPYSESLYSMRKPVALETCLSIFEDLACGLHVLHTNGLIHGMIDLKNAVINGESCKKVEAGWVNFEMTCKPHHGLFAAGYYGSKSYTAPEILKKKTIDAYKADIWAFGQLILQLLQTENLPWHAREGQLVASLKKYVENPKRELSEMKLQQQLSPLETLHLLLYTMLQIDQAQRPDSKEILTTIAFIRTHSVF